MGMAMPYCTTMKRWKMLIGSEWTEALDGRTFERKSPVNGEVVGVYPQGGEADTAAACEVARRVFDDGKWSTGPVKARAAVLRKAADLVRANAETLARVITEEMGKPIASAKGEAHSAADVLEYYAGLALDLHGEAYTQQVPDAIGLAVREPIGVVGVITPWNFPLILICWKLGPALAAGCTVVIKPSHLTSGVALELARLLLEAGLPPGVVNVVTSDTENGAVVGQALATSPLVDKIAFTGSTATGKKVMQASIGTLKRVSLELGGKSPNIVFADTASIDAAAAGAFLGIYANSGQVCQAGSRLLVQESIKDELVEKLVAMTRKKVRLGDPMDPATTMGPIVSEPQLARVLGYVEAGKGSAQLLTGGGRATEGALERGLYVEPTIFDQVSNDMRIAREEIFGPVLSIMTFKDAEEAARIANDTMYGLAAALWTRDLTTAMKLSKSLKAGTIWVNAYHGVGLAGLLPYGGYKQSGIGRELGAEGLREYLEIKSIHIKLA
jgi:acyl-CoA reductase-like NAD-dependent aldehyde dehydrogenase